MKNVLIPIFEIKNKKVGYKLFACDGEKYLDKDYGYPNDGAFKTNKFWFRGITTEDIVKALDLEEVTVKDIIDEKVKLSAAGKYKLSTCFYLSDVDFYRAMETIPHYVAEEGYGSEYYLYGTCDGDFNEIKKVKTSSLIPAKLSFDTSYEGENIYGVVLISSLDEEAGHSIMLFSSKEDALKFTELYKEGELANYIYINGDYSMAVEESIINSEDIKTINFYDICKNPEEYKNLILMPQVICSGIDIYN